MLQKLRDKTSGWIATVILGLLIIPFAFVGIEQYLVQRTNTAVATVSAPPTWWQSAPSWWPVSVFWQTNEVTIEQFRTSFEQIRQQQREEQGEAFDTRAFDTIENKRAVLESLIDREVQRIAAERAGLLVSDELVRKTIESIPAFQVDGKFNLERYQLALASQVPAQTPTEFDQNVRESLQQTLVGGAIAKSSFVTATEMKRLIELLGEKRDVAMVVLPAPAMDTAAISPADVKAWYDAHREDFLAQESVSIEYMELDAEAMPAPAAVDDADLRARFEQDQSRFAEQEQRLASHILVQVDANANAATQTAAQQEATRLAAQAQAQGADFAALARASSDDTGSQAGGGDLGWISKGMMPAPFEQALFAMRVGEVSAPVKTDFGWHVISLREIKAGQKESFESVRDALAREQAVEDRERAFNELSSKIVDAVLENPSSLAAAAKVAGLPVQQIDGVTRDTSVGIAANPVIKRAAFSEALIEDGTVSDPIELGPNHNAWIRVTAHTPQSVLPLAQVRDRVVAAIRADRARSAASKRADALLARLAKGETLQAIATAEGLPEPQVLPGVQRGMPVPEPVAAEAMFAAPVPAAGKTSPGKVVLSDGSIVLFTVGKVTPGSLEEIDPQQRAMLQQQVAEIGGMNDAQAFISALRKRMKVDVLEENL